MGPKEESILYAYGWSAGRTAQPMPDNMEGIEVAADTSSVDSSFVVVKYTFKNFNECHKEMEARKADNI